MFPDGHNAGVHLLSRIPRRWRLAIVGVLIFVVYAVIVNVLWSLGGGSDI
jgi:hypothetical protein